MGLEVLEIVIYQNYEQAREMARLAQTCSTLHRYLHPRLKHCQEVISRFLNNMHRPLQAYIMFDLMDQNLLSSRGRRKLYEYHYPRKLRWEMFGLIGLKSRDAKIRERVRDVIRKENGTFSGRELGDIVAAMSNEDLMYVGW